MKIAVMGSGGVGGYYGGLLARAGQQVHFIARGAHLTALLTDGLQVKSVHGDFVVAPMEATDHPAEIGPVDLVLVCVKTPDTEGAARAIQPIVTDRTAVVSLQNGIEAAERIGAIVGIEHVVGGATWISSAVEAPGVIRQVSGFRRIVLGELDGQRTARVENLAQVLGSTGVDVEVTEDIQKVLWTKFLFIAAISGLGSLTRLPVGAYRDVPQTRELLVSLMKEVKAVGRASGVALDSTVVDQALAVVDSAGPTIKASMQRDVEAGRRSELESMIGVIGRKGRQAGVPTPVADFVYAALLPLELRALAYSSNPSPR
jgi:2-dehydropantoate 2-reductase